MMALDELSGSHAPNLAARQCVRLSIVAAVPCPMAQFGWDDE